MKEVCFINKGESIEKLKKQYGYSDVNYNNNDKKFENYYIEIGKGSDDVLIVKNYLPSILYKVKKNETVLDIMSRGYEIEGVGSTGVNEGDIVILNKPRNLRHFVRPLETLEMISFKYGVEKSVIIETNQLSGEKLFVGQMLWI